MKRCFQYCRQYCWLLSLSLVLIAAGARGEDAGYYLLNYYPGASWNEAVSYEDQPGLKKHHEYLRELHLQDILVMGGPVVGMGENRLSVMVLRTGSLEEAERLANQDPGVQMRLVRAEVWPWNVELSAMRFVRRAPPLNVQDPNQPFSIKRVDPESRLNMD